MAAVDSREQARRIEAVQTASLVATVAARRASHPAEGLDVLEVAGGWAIFAGVGSPITKAEGLGMNGPVAEADLEAVEAFFDERGATTSVTVCPYADPSLLAVLKGRGYRLEELENVFVRPMVEGAPAPSRAVEVVEVVEGADRALWADTVARGFEESGEVTPSSLHAMELFAGVPELRAFLARVDGEPAGGGALMEIDGVASLFCASTIGRYRRRGVQTAALEARLAAAVGCDLAVVMTLPGSPSQRNVERAGFRVAYTKAGLVR